MSHMIHLKKKFGLIIPKFCMLFLLVFWYSVSISKAQGETLWSEMEKIPEFNPIGQQPPYLLADQNNTIHAFNSQPLVLSDENSPKAVFYRQWTKDAGWTYPVDILIDDSGGDIEILDVASNQAGIVYLLYQKNFDEIYYTFAYLSEAGSSFAWAPPNLIANQSTHVGVGFEIIGSIVADDRGNIVVIYSGAESGQGLYSIFSTDDGDNWSWPYPVYLTGDESMVVTDPDLYHGASGKVHAVWATFLNDGSGGPGYYTNFDPEAGVWSDPMELDLSGIRTPSVIEYKTDVLVSYYHSITNGNWWRRSFDGGATWTSPSQLSPQHLGTNGRVSFVVDSADTLHGFFGERINDLNHGIWQITWMGDSWTPPEAIVSGPQIRDVQGGNGFDPAAARAIIGNGNTVLVTWATDGFAGVNGAWYSYKTLNAPALPSLDNVPTPSFINTAISTNTPEEVSPLKLTDTPVALLSGNNSKPSSVFMNPQISILAGASLALILVIGISIIGFANRSRHS